MKRQRDFSTKNADYTLHYGAHNRETKIDDLENYDAIVLESGFHTYEEWKFLDLLYDIQSKDIIKENEKLDEPRPISLLIFRQTNF